MDQVPAVQLVDWDADAEPLVPVGGGKDSVVSIEALKRQGTDSTAPADGEIERGPFRRGDEQVVASNAR